MLRAVLHSVIAWAVVQNTAGNLLNEASGGAAYWYQPQPYIPQPRLQPPPFTPPPQPRPVPFVPNSQVCSEWGKNIISNLWPCIFGNVGGGGAVVNEGIDGFGCTTYSIRVCPQGAVGGAVVGQQQVGEVEEIIDETIVNTMTGQVIAEQREVLDVTNQFYTNQQYQPYGQAYQPYSQAYQPYGSPYQQYGPAYQPYGPSYQPYSPPQPQPQPLRYSPLPQPQIYGGGITYQRSASRSLGDEDDN